MYYTNPSMFHLLPQTCFYQSPMRPRASGVLNELCVYFSDECRKQLMAKAFGIWLILNPALFFHFRSPEVMSCWLLLRVTAPCGVCW